MTHASRKLVLLLTLAAVLVLAPAVKASMVDIAFTVPNTQMSIFSGTYATLEISVPDKGGKASFTLTPGTGILKSSGAAVTFALMGKAPLGLNVKKSSNNAFLLTFDNLDYTPLIGDAGALSLKQPATGNDAHFDGFGDFNTAFITEEGGFANAISSLTFLSTQDFTTASQVLALLVPNSKNYFAAIDFAGYYTTPGPSGGAIATGFASVPIPGAVWLLGSGLLGLVGLKRKFIG